jgi:hypothetical protein
MISGMLQQQQQQQQQQQLLQGPPKALVHLAYQVADSTLSVGNLVAEAHKSFGLQALLGRGPHFVVWSDLTLLLVTYARIFNQQQELPVVDSMPGCPLSDTTPAASPAAAARGNTTTTSSSSSSNRHASKQQRQPQSTSSSMWGLSVTDDDLAEALAAWQQVEGQVDRVPATHKQLLQLLGVSPQAVLWLAAVSLVNGLPIYAPSTYWEWNPHNLATTEGSVLAGAVPTAITSATAVQELQNQVQQWSHTEAEQLLRLLLMFGAASEVPFNDEGINCCAEAIAHALALLHSQIPETDRELSDSQYIQAGLSAAVQGELLSLTLRVLQRMQVLAGTAGTVQAVTAGRSNTRWSGSCRRHPPVAQPAPALLTFPSAAARVNCIDVAEATGIQVLLVLFMVVSDTPAQPTSSSHMPAAAAAADGEDDSVDLAQTSTRWFSFNGASSSAAARTAAAAPGPATGAAELWAAAGAAARLPAALAQEVLGVASLVNKWTRPQSDSPANNQGDIASQGAAAGGAAPDAAAGGPAAAGAATGECDQEPCSPASVSAVLSRETGAIFGVLEHFLRI